MAEPRSRHGAIATLRGFLSLRQHCLAIVGAGAILLIAASSSYGQEPSTNQTLVVLGDSLAAGYGVDPSESWPSKLQEHIREAGLPYTVINAGVSGDTTSGGLRRMDWLLKRRVDWLLLELGGNDGLRGIPLATTHSNLVGIVEKTKAKWPKAQLIIAGMQIPGNMGEEYTRQFRELFPALAAQFHATLIPFLLEGVGGKPELNQADQIHPNVIGHNLVASNVWTKIKPLLTVPATGAAP
ncbi:MAG TPA: arylesterase [Candidatus Limnocylindria bacterium]|nr:arylesterase [Candidatus Limnocylindria bacterium]